MALDPPSASAPALRRSLALSGPMGAGKSTVGRLLAERVGIPFADVDLEIAREAKCSVAEVFSREGEVAFRAREAKTIDRLLADQQPRILSLGGGAVTHEPTRRALLRQSVLVTLDAPIDDLFARVAPRLAERPLLARSENPRRTLELLVEARRVAYAEAHARISTHGRSPNDVVVEVEDLWRREPVAVPLGERSYRVEIGPGMRRTLSSILVELVRPGGSVLVVSEDRVWPLVRERIEKAIVGVGARVLGAPLVFPAGEENKTLQTVASLWDGALSRGVDRKLVVLAVGGGVVGDVAGFFASTLLRGVRFVQVPTTLLAMVDASVGGKTGIDRPQGKNLVGSFHQPSAVVADTELLETLPIRDLRSGLAEVVKTALISDVGFLESLEREADDLARASADGLCGASALRLAAVVRASVEHKARVVSDDEHDLTGARAALNFGHTLGHALEAHGGFTRLTHGEAVGLGMIAALRIGRAFGYGDEDLERRTTALLGRLGLPNDLDAEPLGEALGLASTDKKREGDKIAFVLLPEVGKPTNVRLSLDEVRKVLVPRGS